jgi:hypothetical protein
MIVPTTMKRIIAATSLTPPNGGVPSSRGRTKFAANVLRHVATNPGQKPPKYAAIMTAGKIVICGTASLSTGQSGQRISNDTAVASTARA